MSCKTFRHRPPYFPVFHNDGNWIINMSGPLITLLFDIRVSSSNVVIDCPVFFSSFPVFTYGSRTHTPVLVSRRSSGNTRTIDRLPFRPWTVGLPVVDITTCRHSRPTCSLGPLSSLSIPNDVRMVHRRGNSVGIPHLRN